MANPTAAWRRLPILVRFLIGHGAVGFGLSAVFVAALLAYGPQHAAALLLSAAGHWWPVVVLWFFTGLTFGAVQIGIATMLLAEDEAPRPGGGTPARLVPIPVRADRRRR